MNKKGPILERIQASPLLAVEMVLAFVLLLSGAIIANPFVVIDPVTIANSPVLRTIASQIGRSMIGSFLMSGAWLTLFGIKDGNIKRRRLGLLLMFSAYLFLFLLRIIAVGWSPATWVLLLGFTLISGICRLAARSAD